MGDLELMKYSHNKDYLEKAIRQGHGAAVLILREMTDEELHCCMELVTHAACNDLRYDHQCNADRTQYIFDLLDSFGADDRSQLRNEIVQDSWQAVVKNSDIFGLKQYINILKRFSAEGFTSADEILEKVYITLREEYESRTESPPIYDELFDKYAAIAALIGRSAVRVEHVHNDVTRKPDEILTVERVIEIVRNTNGTVIPTRFRQFFLKKATSDDTDTILKAARNESNPIIKAKLYALFSQTDFPGEVTELITAAKEFEDNLTGDSFYRDTARFLHYALARLRHPTLREYAFDLLERGRNTESEAEKYALITQGFSIWAANYDEKSDIEKISKFIAEIRQHDNEYVFSHSIDCTITQDMFNNHRYDDPRTYSLLVSVFTNTFCSCCRRNAVTILSEHGMLQKSVRKEALFDCDPETRMIAENTAVI